MKRIAVVPGSFDPITNGHVDLIRRAAKLFGSCEVVVMNNREKEYRFTLEERYRLCRSVFESDSQISVTSSEGMLYEYLSGRSGEAVLVKGIRNEKDYLYEKKMAEFNFLHSGVETLYLDAREDLRDLSSTLVRQKMQENEELSAYLPKEVVKLLQNKL